MIDLNQAFLGQKFYNQLQILEDLVLCFLAEFAVISAINSSDNYTNVNLSINGSLINLVISYLPGVLILDSTSTLTLYAKNYIRPFTSKVYTTTAKKNFTNLLYSNRIPNLYACIKNQFIKTPTFFTQLPRHLLAEILSFLDTKSLLQSIVTHKELNQLVNSSEIWKEIHCSRFGNYGFGNINLNWKKIYIQEILK
jgi:F-box domain